MTTRFDSDFMYTGEIPDVGRDLSFLLEVLGLSNYWGMTRLHEEVQRVIIEKRLITPETLETGMTCHFEFLSMLRPWHNSQDTCGDCARNLGCRSMRRIQE